MKSCPWCRSIDVRYYAAAIGTRFKCLTCHAEGPPAPQGIQGITSAETSKLRAIAAETMWNARKVDSKLDTAMRLLRDNQSPMHFDRELTTADHDILREARKWR